MHSCAKRRERENKCFGIEDFHLPSGPRCDIIVPLYWRRDRLVLLNLILILLSNTLYCLHLFFMGPKVL
ncbi:hypothetical protein PRUPE_8G074600 [Prunus persica]|uniref:Uncharacterized protein n=1 Tax=Prunus persica TaxID=3760 RepID=A0A251MUN4_PRUPE|nr:hypothetical protein PRUPE_8G074600 [Prunus persica]